jgi:ribosomal protein L11 methylase PrmA
VRGFVPALSLCLCAVALLAQEKKPLRTPDTVYIPSPDAVVTAMLRLAHVGRGDVVYDLGSGDGRIPIAAVKEFGADRGVGVDLDGARVKEGIENARRAGVAGRVEFRQEDMFETDLRPATVVVLYLSTPLNQRLRPKMLAELRPGSRVVSHVFDMGSDWAPAEQIMVNNRPVFLWRIDAR